MRYPDEHSRSRSLFASAQQYLPGGNTRTTVYMRPYPIYAARGSGCRVWDVDGVPRIDCINNFTSQIHGYAHPVITAAIREQAECGTAFGLPTASEIDLARLICERTESIETIRFTNSGTEAVMMALKAARAYTGRPKIAKVEGAYHGSYDYSEVSLDSTPANWGDRQPVSVAYAAGTPRGITDDVIVLPFNDPETARAMIEAHGRDLAGVLVDPMPNRAGLVPATTEYMAALRDACTAVGALLIVDEIIVFRLGMKGAQPCWGIRADLTTLGKIIGGGFPVGAVGGRRDVMQVFDPSRGKPALPHGGTFSANPMSMRAGLAAMQLLDPPAFDKLERIGTAVRNGIGASLERHGVAGTVVGRGSLLKVHFTSRPVRDYRSAFPTADEARRLALFNRGLLNRGILAAGYGLMALSTPMTDADVEEILRAADGAVADVAAVSS